MIQARGAELIEVPCLHALSEGVSCLRLLNLDVAVRCPSCRAARGSTHDTCPDGKRHHSSLIPLSMVPVIARIPRGVPSSRSKCWLDLCVAVRLWGSAPEPIEVLPPCACSPCLDPSLCLDSAVNVINSQHRCCKAILVGENKGSAQTLIEVLELARCRAILLPLVRPSCHQQSSSLMHATSWSASHHTPLLH